MLFGILHLHGYSFLGTCVLCFLVGLILASFIWCGYLIKNTLEWKAFADKMNRDWAKECRDILESKSLSFYDQLNNNKELNDRIDEIARKKHCGELKSEE